MTTHISGAIYELLSEFLVLVKSSITKHLPERDSEETDPEEGMVAEIMAHCNARADV